MSSRHAWVGGRPPGGGARRVSGRTRARRPGAGPLRAWLPPLLVGTLLGGLLLAVLRVDVIRARYGLAAALAEERDLLDERRLLTAELRQLRSPARLARLAGERQLARPERLIELPAPPTSEPVRP